MDSKECKFATPMDKETYECGHKGHPYAGAHQPICHRRFCPLSNEQEGRDIRKISKD